MRYVKQPWLHTLVGIGLVGSAFAGDPEVPYYPGAPTGSFYHKAAMYVDENQGMRPENGEALPIALHGKRSTAHNTHAVGEHDVLYLFANADELKKLKPNELLPPFVVLGDRKLHLTCIEDRAAIRNYFKQPDALSKLKYATALIKRVGIYNMDGYSDYESNRYQSQIFMFYSPWHFNAETGKFLKDRREVMIRRFRTEKNSTDKTIWAFLTKPFITQMLPNQIDWKGKVPNSIPNALKWLNSNDGPGGGDGESITDQQTATMVFWPVEKLADAEKRYKLESDEEKLRLQASKNTRRRGR